MEPTDSGRLSFVAVRILEIGYRSYCPHLVNGNTICLILVPSLGWDIEQSSFPHVSHPSEVSLANNSILLWLGNILVILSRTSVGFCECLPRSSDTNCLTFLAPRGVGILPRLNTKHSSHSDIV